MNHLFCSTCYSRLRFGVPLLIVWLAVAMPAAAADWPMGRGNITGTGATSEELPADMALLWEVENEGLGYEAGPIVADGMVFAADADGEVQALKLATGESVWQKSFDVGFMASPAYRDGVLYVGNYDGVLMALDAKTGEEKWRYTGAELEVDSSPNFFGDSVLFTSRGGSLHAVNVADGGFVWKYDTGDQLRCGPTLADNRTFLGGCDARLHVVDVASGQPIGEPVPIDSPTSSTPSFCSDRIFVPTYSGEIIAFKHPSNEIAWRFKDAKLSSEFKNSVSVADGLVVAASGRRAFALDAETGELKWEHAVKRKSDASPVIAGDRVVIADSDGRISILDLKTGQEKWMFEVKGGFLGSAAVADGKLVVCSDRGTTYCFGKKK